MSSTAICGPQGWGWRGRAGTCRGESRLRVRGVCVCVHVLYGPCVCVCVLCLGCVCMCVSICVFMCVYGACVCAYVCMGRVCVCVCVCARTGCVYPPALDVDVPLTVSPCLSMNTVLGGQTGDPADQQQRCLSHPPGSPSRAVEWSQQPCKTTVQRPRLQSLRLGPAVCQGQRVSRSGGPRPGGGCCPSHVPPHSPPSLSS